MYLNNIDLTLNKNFTQQTAQENSSYVKNLIFNAQNFGKVVKVKDGVAFVTNLKNVTFGELVLFIPSPLRLKKYREQNQKP